MANLPVSVVTGQITASSQASTSHVTVSQSTSSAGSQAKAANVNITAGNSVVVPLTLADRTVDINAKDVASVNAGAITTQMTHCAPAVSTLPLLTSFANAGPSSLKGTSLTTVVPVTTSQTPSNNTQAMPSVSLTVQSTIPSVSIHKNIIITAPTGSKPFSNFVDSTVNLMMPPQGALSVNTVANAVSAEKHQLTNASSSLSSNSVQSSTTTNFMNVPLNMPLPPSTVSTSSQATPSVNLSTQVIPSSRSYSPPSTSVRDNIPWSTIFQTSANANIISSQTHTAQSSSVQSTDVQFNQTSVTDTTSAPAPCPSLSLIDSTVTSSAPVDTSLDICAMADNSTAPSLMSPQSLQSILQSMLSQTDIQLLWNTMLSSPMMASPIFKQADTSNSSATTTCTATDSQPKLSPVKVGTEQFTAQPSNGNLEDAGVSQQTSVIPENIHDALSDLNVQEVQEEAGLAEEVIFSSRLSSYAKATGSGYGIGRFNINELLNDAGIIQDPLNL